MMKVKALLISSVSTRGHHNLNPKVDDLRAVSIPQKHCGGKSCENQSHASLFLNTDFILLPPFDKQERRHVRHDRCIQK